MVKKLEEMNMERSGKQQNNKTCQRGLYTSIMALMCVGLFWFNIYTTTRRTQLSERHYNTQRLELDRLSQEYNRNDRLSQEYNRDIQTLDKEFQSTVDRLKLDRLSQTSNKNIQKLDREFQSVIDRLDKAHTDSLYQLHENLVRVTKEAFDNAFSDYEID